MLIGLILLYNIYIKLNFGFHQVCKGYFKTSEDALFKDDPKVENVNKIFLSVKIIHF